MKLPAVEQPETVRQAANTLLQRKADLAVQQELRAAKAGIDEARAEDRQLYALAMDADEADPGPRHLRAAEEHLADVQRRVEFSGLLTGLPPRGSRAGRRVRLRPFYMVAPLGQP